MDNNLEKIKEIEKNSNKKIAIDYFCEVFGIKNAYDIFAEEYGRGTTNNIYRVTYKNKKYIVRIPGKNTDIFIDRNNEKKVYDVLKGHDIFEKLIDYGEDGYKITEFFENARSVNMNNPEDVKKCMAIYRKFHSLDLCIDFSCDVWDVYERYIEILSQYKIKVDLENFDENVKFCEKVCEKLKSYNRPRTLCHGDPGSENILITDEGTKVIDVEYAGMADPISDIALYGVYMDYDMNKTYDLYKIYKTFDKYKLKDGVIVDDDVIKDLIYMYMTVTCMSSTIWAYVRKKVSVVLHEYDYYAKYELFNKYKNIISRNINI